MNEAKNAIKDLEVIAGICNKILRSYHQIVELRLMFTKNSLNGFLYANQVILINMGKSVKKFEIPKTLGLALKPWRKSYNLTQDEVAETWNLTQPAISKMEKQRQMEIAPFS